MPELASGGAVAARDALREALLKPLAGEELSRDEAVALLATPELTSALLATASALDGGLRPHTNAGLLSRDEMARLKEVNVSLGLMLENVSPRLRARGQVHQWAPDKEPALRLRMLREAGELRIPFTTGLLLGIGETLAERVDTLFAIRDLHRAYGHVQEVIVQNFRAKPTIPLADASEPAADDIAPTVAR